MVSLLLLVSSMILSLSLCSFVTSAFSRSLSVMMMMMMMMVLMMMMMVIMMMMVMCLLCNSRIPFNDFSNASVIVMVMMVMMMMTMMTIMMTSNCNDSVEYEYLLHHHFL